MSLLGLILVVFLIAVVFGGFYGGPTAGVGFYPRQYGFGIGGVLLVIFIVLLLTGRL